MKRAILSTAIVLLFTGCSHNAITYSDGVGFESTIRPDTGTFGVNFRYGKILTAIVRENSEVDMKGDASTDTGSTSSNKAGASGSLKVKIGKQWNGYLVDAITASNDIEAAKSYFSDGATNKSDEDNAQPDKAE